MSKENSVRTSKPVASKASKVLTNAKSGKTAKSVSGSALSNAKSSTNSKKK